MLRLTIGLVVICLTGAAADKSVTWTGWFSDFRCASARGIIGPTNPDCARTCIEKGAAPAFISEQAKAVFQVKDYPALIGDLGYHVEIDARVDESARTIAVVKVTRLEYQGPACARPRKTTTK